MESREVADSVKKDSNSVKKWLLGAFGGDIVPKRKKMETGLGRMKGEFMSFSGT
jgi:hypothetical protein